MVHFQRSAGALTLTALAIAIATTFGAANEAAAQECEGTTKFLLGVSGNVHMVDHDDLSPNEICDKSFLSNLALLSDTQRKGGGSVPFEQCDDGVMPIIEINATLLDNGWAHVRGRTAMWSMDCRFNNTPDPCTWPGTGTFTIRNIDVVMKPGQRLDIRGAGVHTNTVDFSELVLFYDEVCR